MSQVKSDRVRVAMIGAGRMANRVHYPSLASFDDVEIAAICDINPQALNETADRYGVSKRYPSASRRSCSISGSGVSNRG